MLGGPTSALQQGVSSVVPWGRDGGWGSIRGSGVGRVVGTARQRSSLWVTGAGCRSGFCGFEVRGAGETASKISLRRR